MRRASSVGVVLFSLAVLLGARPAFAQRFHVQSEAEQGEQLYQANCITCHGLEGDEVSGIDFGKGRYKRATSDDDLMRITGWASREMIARYGAAAGSERARIAHARLSPVDGLK